VFRTNSFAAPVVKVQTERDHHVISSGPYALVRHPMYTSVMLFFIAVPTMLGSWWGLAFVPVFFRDVCDPHPHRGSARWWRDCQVMPIMRRGVRYRLVPGLW
jgi:hypothetical protein